MREQNKGGVNIARLRMQSRVLYSARSAVPSKGAGGQLPPPPPIEIEVINSALTDRAYRWLRLLFAIVSNVPQRRSLRVYVQEIKKIR